MHDEVAWLSSRQRQGELPSATTRIAAALGHPAASALTGVSPVPPGSSALIETLEQIDDLEVLFWGACSGLRQAAREGTEPFLGVVERVVTAVEGWLTDGSEGRRQVVIEASRPLRSGKFHERQQWEGDPRAEAAATLDAVVTLQPSRVGLKLNELRNVVMLLDSFPEARQVALREIARRLLQEGRTGP